MDALAPMKQTAASLRVPDVSQIDCSAIRADAPCPTIESIPGLREIDSSQLAGLVASLQQLLAEVEERMGLLLA